MDEIQAGRQAEMLLSDPVFQLAVERADAAFVEQWRQATTRGEREQAHALQAALAQVLGELEIIVGRGDVAKTRSE